MSSRLTRQTSSPSRMLSLLTAAILMAGAAPLMAATAPEQSTHKMGDYSFAIPQQSLVSALNAFTAVTGWQVGVSSELAQGVASPGVRGSLPGPDHLGPASGVPGAGHPELNENYFYSIAKPRTSRYSQCN